MALEKTVFQMPKHPPNLISQYVGVALQEIKDIEKFPAERIPDLRTIKRSISNERTRKYQENRH